MDAQNLENGRKDNKPIRLDEENWKWLMKMKYEFNLPSVNAVVSMLREVVTTEHIERETTRRRGI